MKTCGFLDPVTSKFLLLLIQSVSYLDAFGKQNLLCHVLDIFPFLQLTFFSGIGFAQILAGTNLKQSECVLSLNLLVVSTFCISSLAGKSYIKMLLSPEKLG